MSPSYCNEVFGSLRSSKPSGKGAYGEVKLAELHKRNGNVVTVAAKTISHEIGETPKKIKEMLKEARIMRGLRHPNIVSFVGVVLIDQPIYIILELIQGGALDVYLRKNHKHVTSEERLRFAMGVAWGMEYLHNVKILHRDLAARNCLYDGKIYVKISDFGLSKKGTTYKMKAIQKMPIRYMAPESLQEYIFTQKTDVYTYGVSCISFHLLWNHRTTSSQEQIPQLKKVAFPLVSFPGRRR
ncbi:protein tyrosine kinase [Cooperia oncophora]